MSSRSKSFKKKAIKWTKRVVLVAGIALWFGLATGLSRNQSAQPTQEAITIDIKNHGDAKLVTEQQVFELLTKEYGRPVRGESLNKLQLDTLEQIARSIPHLEEVHAHVDMHGRLSLSITQKQPLARVLHTDGVSYYIDKEGLMMPLTDNFTARVPVISGVLPMLRQGESVHEYESWSSVFSLMNAIRGNTFTNALTEQVHRDASGDFLLVPKIGDCLILLGTTNQLESKFARLKTFCASDDISLSAYETIDLRFSGQVVCKKRQP